MKINSVVSGVSLCFLLGWTNLVTASPATNDAQVESSICETRLHYAEINKLAAKSRQVKKELAGFSTEGGTLIAYFDGDNLMKIVATFYGESGEATEEYYYWKNQLIFVFKADSDYDHLLSGKIARTAEDRFYFSHDTLIRWIDEHAKQVDPSNAAIQEMQKQYLQSSARFVRGVRSIDPVIVPAG